MNKQIRKPSHVVEGLGLSHMIKNLNTVRSFINFRNLFVFATDSVLPRNWTNLGCEEVIRMYACYLYLTPSPTCLPSSTDNSKCVGRCELVFENCFVPEENVLGQEGRGRLLL